ncbi:hypothetical protein BTUL_0127g00110 [Botrytis tulipae]|uniref:Uncharacterized protein n=1 Tax=Botrytis tulipae TaxID=87230 RepID=A0A4Z1EIT3_9HELO|nr:hypothetical protein BTUL_0127g00110 [Botrytis tulipae]
MRKLDGSGPPRSYQPQVVPRLSAGNQMTEMTPLYDKPWRSGGWFSIIGRELSTLTSGPGSIELQPVAQSENSAYRKRRSAGKFSGGVCCASFRSRIDWEKKSAGRYGGGVQKTMEDPDTIDSEVEPPQKAGLRSLGPIRKCLFVPISGLCVLSPFELPSAGNEAAIARWKFNRARTEKEHRA